MKELIEFYTKQIETIDQCLDDLHINMLIAKQEDTPKDDHQYISMLKSRDTFLTIISCYSQFVEELKEIIESN